MKISTKMGDNGESSLRNDQRLSKGEPVFDVLGDADELNSFVGWCLVFVREEIANGEVVLHENGFGEILEKVQGDLLKLGSNVSGGQGDLEAEVKFLEDAIEKLEEKVNIEGFVRPGGSELSARLHIARTVCRRVERTAVRAKKAGQLEADSAILQYLNRLSDLLFMLAIVAGKL